MSIGRKAALLAGVLLLAAWANAASRSNLVSITVLDSQTRALPLTDNGVPQNCEQLTFDAYCRSTQTAPLVSTLLVQVGNSNEPPFRVSCTIESRFSRCQPLPKGESFDARREKHGVTIFYVDDKGKARQEFYKFVDADNNSNSNSNKDTNKKSEAAAAPVAAVRPPSSVAVAPVRTASPQPASSGSMARSSPMAVAQPQIAGAPGPGWVQTVNPEKVRCNFASTPAGAEITVDGQYVGNTPSAIALTTGTHIVALSLGGFSQWKRELTVMPASELNVSPVLQKQAQ